ncbi:MAG TPA: hypothetical protein VM753_18555, partial [Anaeromyxobacter sp.]|nr:hypothetical protein [Anaeromyxobacter sp.]
ASAGASSISVQMIVEFFVVILSCSLFTKREVFTARGSRAGHARSRAARTRSRTGGPYVTGPPTFVDFDQEHSANPRTSGTHRVNFQSRLRSAQVDEMSGS